MNLLSRKTETLLRNPLFSKENLGKAIPGSEHSVSVCMPTFESVIKYEKQNLAVLNSFCAGYPRFFLNPTVKKFFDTLGKNTIVFPSLNTALRAKRFYKKNTNSTEKPQIKNYHDFLFYFDFYRQSDFDIFFKYWQHTGEIISSRLAKALLEKKIANFSFKSQNSKRLSKKIKERISDLVGQKPEDIYLFPSGMAAIFFALRILNFLSEKKTGNLHTIQLGFPYVDTYKLQELFSKQNQLFCLGDSKNLEKYLRSNRISGLLTEVFTNPLLQTPDLEEIKSLGEKYVFPVVVDDTLAGFGNLELSKYADLLVSSLTKFFNGEGDLLAGSLVLSRQSAFYSQIKEFLRLNFEELVWEEDLKALEFNSRSYQTRIKKINQTTRKVAFFLKEKFPQKLEQIFYPDFDLKTRDNLKFLSSKKKNFGGGVISFVLKNPKENTAKFFDELRISKGPSLGTNYSLVCLYTLLAHFNNLEFAQRYGVNKYLIRLSIGLEEPEELTARLEEAFKNLS